MLVNKLAVIMSDATDIMDSEGDSMMEATINPCYPQSIPA